MGEVVGKSIENKVVNNLLCQLSEQSYNNKSRGDTSYISNSWHLMFHSLSEQLLSEEKIQMAKKKKKMRP